MALDATGPARGNAPGVGSEREAAVWTMRVVVLDVFPEKRPQVPLVQHDEMVQTVIAEGPDHAFCDGIRRGAGSGSNPCPARPR